MYLPGLSHIVLFFVSMLTLILALARGTPLPPLTLASFVGAYFVYHNRVELIELIYGERGLLIDPVYNIKMKRDYIIIEMEKKIVVSAFLKIIDLDYPDSESKLGDAAASFISSLHIPHTTVNIISRGGQPSRDFYIKVNLLVKKLSPEVLKGFSLLLQDLQRRLLSLGIHSQPTPPREVLSLVLDFEETFFRPIPPVLTITLILAGLLLIYFYSNLSPIILVLTPLIPLELKVVKGKKIVLKPKDLEQLRYIVSEIPDPARAGALVKSFKSTMIWLNSIFVSLLIPEDPAELSAKAQKAMEVLEAGRAGVSKLRDEFTAMNVINLYKALETGATPFKFVFYTNGFTRGLEALGFERKLSLSSLLGKKTYYNTLHAIIGIPVDKDMSLKVNKQLVWLTPYIFMRPRTTRTPRAIYLGHSLRRDEEVWLELDLLENVHGLVIGPMGSGKSTTARTISLRALSQGIVPIFIDPSGEYRPFAQCFNFEVIDLIDKPFNILENSLEDLVRALSYLSPLSEYETHLLRQHLVLGNDSLQELIDRLGECSLSWKLERLRPYFGGKTVSLSRLLSKSKPIVFCLGSLSEGNYKPMPVEVQRTAFDLLLAQLRDYVVSQGLNEPRWLLIVDEGHLFMQPSPGFSEPCVVTMARMLRKFGLAITILTHEWGDVPEGFRRAAGWKLALAHSDPDYVSMTHVYMALSASELTWFQRGIRGRAILRRGHEPHNILVEIEPIEEAKTDLIHTHAKTQ